MKKIFVSLMLVAFGCIAFAGPVAADSHKVRIPKSAADWATFTPAERQAAYDWVNIHETKPLSTLVITTPMTSMTSSSAGLQAMAVSGLIVGGECGWSISSYSTGSRVAAWSQVHTSQVVYWLDTGMQGYVDQLWRNGARSYTTYGGRGGAGANYVFASTSYDWKWFWETVHYTFQAWDSVETSAGVWYWRNAYCVTNYDA